jgi:hypothetical protein
MYQFASDHVVNLNDLKNLIVIHGSICQCDVALPASV